MYAVIRTGGKQYKVAPGDRLRVEKLGAAAATLTPLLVVDGDEVTSDAAALAGMPVEVRVVEDGRGKKIVAGKYKSKSRYRRRWGHRQDYSLIEVQSIAGVSEEPPSPEESEEPEAGTEEVEAGTDEVEAGTDVTEAEAPVGETEALPEEPVGEVDINDDAQDDVKQEADDVQD